jgi:hypothetical protein
VALFVSLLLLGRVLAAAPPGLLGQATTRGLLTAALLVLPALVALLAVLLATLLALTL